MQGYFEIITDHDLAQAQALLAASGLSLPAGRTYGLGFYEDGHLAACGFLADAEHLGAQRCQLYAVLYGALPFVAKHSSVEAVLLEPPVVRKASPFN